MTMLKRMIAGQLSCPSGSLAPFVLSLVWNRRNAALNDGALLRLRADRSDRVLDVGFGGGYLIKQLLNKVAVGHVSGVDVSPAMVKQCRRRFAKRIRAGELDLRCATVDALPYGDGSFEKVVSVNSLFFWRDFRRGIDEMRRVLSPNGVLVLGYTCKQDLDRRGFSCHGVRSFGDDEVAGGLEEEGLREVLVEHERDKYREYVIVTATR